tara:strand:- start:97 stop:1110 length:1014 start_codon:yes stop_codon:yes gene_type:complete
MNKKNSKYIIGLTLIEILIGIVITSIMMAAMYTSYNVVNQSYSKVAEKAKISKASRDLVSMLMRDIRMAGFRYYAGTHEIAKFSDDTKNDCITPIILLPKVSYLEFDNGFIKTEDSHNPVVIRKNTLGEGIITTGESGEICCDQIQIVYEDFNQNDLLQPFKKYKITYFADSLNDGIDKDGKEINPRYAVYKKIQSWSQPRADVTDCVFPPTSVKKWVPNPDHPNDVCPECTQTPVLVKDYIVDMEFIPFDENGRILRNAAGKFPAPEIDDYNHKLYDIRGVDVRLTFRSKEDFFRKKISRITSGLSNRDVTNEDRILRDSVIVSVHTRNIGGESFQ